MQNNNIFRKPITRKKKEPTRGDTNNKKPVIRKKIYTPSEPYKIFNGSSFSDLERKDKEDYVICAIDPAFKNCAVRIEGKNRKTLFQEKYSFSLNKEVTVCYNKVIEVFMSLKDKLKECDFILIECQHHKNKDMLKIGQTILTVLLMMFPADSPLSNNNKRPLIVEVEAKIKSSPIYAAPHGSSVKMKKPELKKWAVKKGLEILELNDDQEAIKKINQIKKKDDLCDVVLYTTCWRNYFCTVKNS